MLIGGVINYYSIPSNSTAKKIAALYRDRGCDSIAIGGNSPAAAAKGAEYNYVK